MSIDQKLLATARLPASRTAKPPAQAIDRVAPLLDDRRHSRAHWGGVFAMTLCVFALIASEFMPVSLLTPIAADLHVSEGMAGPGDRDLRRLRGADQPVDLAAGRQHRPQDAAARA